MEFITDPISLYENAPCGYVSFTADGRIVKINQTLLNWLGYQRDDVVQKLHFKDLISKGGQIYYEMFYFPLLLIQDQVNEINFDQVRRDGTRFPALINSNVIHDEEGNLLAVNATVYDITDRKKYENELLEAKNTADTERSKFESLADFLPELIWTADAQGKISYVNKRFAEFFNITQDTYPAHLILSRVHDQDRFCLLRNWLKAVREDKSFQVEVRLQSREHVFRWHLIRALPQEQLDGSSKWMGSCTNIDQHITKIHKLDEFISIASHELKTPITTLKASLQLMKAFIERAGDPILSKLHEQTDRSAGKINDLVTDLLNAGSIKEGRVSLNISNFNVRTLLLNTCPHVSATGVYRVVVDCPEDLNVVADQDRIDQVLVNFVNNAIKYAPDSKVIYLNAEKLDNHVKISVKDLGPGIAAEKLPYVFERYYRVNNSSSQYTGLGLGLYIASEIIKRHEGKIGVDSIPGQGTTFWFTLPTTNKYRS